MESAVVYTMRKISVFSLIVLVTIVAIFVGKKPMVLNVSELMW